jgi:hypothetical protein
MGQTWTRALLLLMLLLLGMQHMNSSSMQVQLLLLLLLIKLLVATHQQLQQHSETCHPHQSGPGLHLSSGAGHQQLQHLLSKCP